MQGILFKPWKQKAIRESPLDKLWQTRRLDHLKEINKQPGRWTLTHFMPDYSGFEFAHHFSLTKSLWVKPRYRVGETVYIKEAWYAEKQYDHLKPSEIPIASLIGYPARDKTPNWAGKLRSPMFMPSWAARTFIKITDVRPSRLQDITAEDIEAEGTRVWLEQHPDYLDFSPFSAKQCFSYLWDSINGKTYPFDGNWWVWRICFNWMEGNE